MSMNADTLAAADIVVVGAGIVGLCTAWELRRRGFDVVVVEQRFPAFGASGRNPGAIWLQTRRSGVELELARAGKRKYEEFLAEMGDVFEYRNRGGLFFFETEEQGRALEAYVADRLAAGLEVEMVSRKQAAVHSAVLPETAIGAVFCADDAQVDAQHFVNALSAACVRAGVRVFENTAVLATIRQGDAVLGVHTVRGAIYGSGVVWATGAWAANLRMEGIALPMETMRLGLMVTQPIDQGNSALLHGPRGVYGSGALLDLPGFDPELFAAPSEIAYDDTIAQNRGGSMYVGSSMDGRGSLNPHISMNATHALITTTLKRYGALADFGVTGLWGGLGCEAPDHLPLVDSTDGAYVNTAHAWGMASGPISGQVMAEIIAGEPSTFAAALRLDRAALDLSAV